MWDLSSLTRDRTQAPALGVQSLKHWATREVIHFTVVAAQSLNTVWFFVTSWTAARQASLSFTISQSLLKLMSIESVMPSIISSSVVPFSFYLQSFPASGSFPVNRLFTSGGQNIGASAPASVFSTNIQDWFPLGLTFFNILAVQETLESSPTPQFKSINSSALSLLYGLHLTSNMTTGKTIVLTIQTLVGKVVPLLCNTLSRFVIAFLPRNKHLLISWLQSPSAVILEPKKVKSVTVSIVSPSICHEVVGPDAMISVFWMLSFKPAFLLSSFTFIKSSLAPLRFLP